MKLVQTLIIALTVLTLHGVANAQNVDCSQPDNLSQQGMNICAYEAYLSADEDLNAFYKIARADLKSIDTYLQKDQRGGADALRDAQRAWIVFRDNACKAEGFTVRGGSLEPLIVSSCKERLTRVRTEDLRSAFEAN
tara:strand:+ start:55 stop:465 length:411 start_codon:yes stop_codon:yes gene_type:complete